jgi:DNA-binding HxlR family transcriptional regulator
MKNHFGCPVQATSNVLAGKWKVLIIWHLSRDQGPLHALLHRPHQLRKATFKRRHPMSDGRKSPDDA